MTGSAVAAAGLALSASSASAAEALKMLSGGLKYTNYTPFEPWVAFVPGKSMGNISAIDLGTGTSLSHANIRWVGDAYGLTHHVCAMPTMISHGHSDARKGFTGFFSTQISNNIYQYDYLGPFNTDRLKTIKKWGSPDFKLPARNMRLTNLSELTGIGAGVHTQLSPDAKMLTVTDGQKDLVGFINTKTKEGIKVLTFTYDPTGKVVKMTAISPGKNGKFDFFGKKGSKIDKEVSMGEEDKAPKDMPVADAMCFDPRGRWASVSLRRLGSLAIIDVDNWKMVAVVATAEGQKNCVQVGKNAFKYVGDVKSTMHQQGFAPSGKFLLGCNNVLQNNVGVIDSSDHNDPTKWKTVTFIKGWGRYLPFHMGFRPPAGDTLYMTSWSHQKQGKDSSIAFINTKTWEIEGFIPVGPDMHTPQCTYDGKWVTAIHGGWQGMSYSSLVIADTSTNKLVARMPIQQDPHGHVIVPRTLEDLKFSHSTTV